MAANNNRVNIQITVDGKQAELTLNLLQKEVDTLKNNLDDMKNGAVPFDEARYKNMQQELKQLNLVLGATMRETQIVENVMNDLSGSTLRKLQSALREVKREMLSASEDNNKLELLRQQYAAIDGQIQKLRKDYVDVNDVVNNLDIATEKMMRQAILQLREMRENTLRGTQEWNNYDAQIKKIDQTLNSLSGKKVVNPQDVMQNINIASTSEIKEAISQMESMREQQVLGGTEWQKYGVDIQKAKEYLAQFTEEQKMSIQTAQQISAAPGGYNIKEAQEAISVLKEYRNTLSVSDTSGLQQVDAQIQAINNSLIITKDRIIDTTNILNDPQNFSAEQIKQAISEANKELDKMAMNDPARNGLKNQIEQLNKVLKETKDETVDVQNVLSRLPNASMKELTQAAKQLKDEMDQLDTTTDRYAQKKTEYIQIQKQIEGINQSFNKQENTIEKVMKRLVAYVGIYGVFNFVTGKLSEWMQGNVELSDSLADIQKTTGLTEKQVGALSKEIDGIDTRTSQEELHKLAFEAGKLGISAKDDVMAFVEAGNQVRVALGEDLGDDAIKNLMKLNQVLGTTKELGVERALLATGSAINEVGQSSTASEGYMVDFAQRLGGIAAQSNLTMAELVALGGTTDALGQNVEVSATALNKFVVAVQTNTRAVAQAAGINDEYLKGLLDSGQTMQAIIEVLEGLGKKGGLAELAPLMGDLGSDGARLTAVLTSMSGNVDLLKAQLYTANQGFEQAISVTNEYNIKNENAAAIIARMGNSIKEYFINSSMVEWLKNVLAYIYDLPNALERNIVVLGALKGVLTSITLLLTLKGLKAATTFLKTVVVDALTMVTGSFSVLSRAISIHTVGVTGLRKAWITLNLVMKSNWFGVILTAVAAVGYAIYEFYTHTSKAEQAMKEANIQLEEENYQLTSLKSKIDKANAANGERQALITQLNNTYSSYLGYMLSESATAEQVAQAYKLINSELERKAMLEAKEDAKKGVREKYSSVKVSATGDLRSQLESNYGIAGEMQADMVQYIQELVYQTDMSAEDVVKALESKYKQSRGIGKKIWDVMFQTDQQFGGSTNDLIPLINKFKATLQQESKELENVALTFDGEIAVWSKKSINERQSILNEWSQNIFTPKALNNVQQSKKDIDTYIQVNNQQLTALQESGKGKTKQYETVSKNIEFAKSQMEKLNFKTSTKSIWGDDLTIETQSVDQLVAKYKELADFRKTIKGDKNYTAFKDKGFKTAAEEMEWYLSKMKEVEDKLKSMGYNRKGNLLSGGGNTENKKLKTQKDTINEAKRLQDAQRSEKETAIKQSSIDMSSSDVAMQKELMRSDKEFYLARAALLRTFLESKEKDGKTFVIKDKAFRAQLEKEEAESLNKATELQQKHQKEINKILEDQYPIEKVRTEYQNKLEELDLFNGKDEKLTQEQATERMKILTEFSKDSYSMDAASLQKRLQENGMFGSLMKNLNQKDYEAMLAILQNYLVASEEAEQKDQMRKERIRQRKWNLSDDKKEFDKGWSDTEVEEKGLKSQKELGVISDVGYNNMENEIILQRIQLLQAQAEARKDDAVVHADLLNQATELEQQYTQNLMENIMERTEETGKFASFFGDYLGEKWQLEKQINAARAKGDEDTARKLEKQQKQSKQKMIQNALSELVDLAAIWAKQAATKLMMNSIMAASDSAANKKEITDKSNVSLGKMLLDAFTGQTHEIGTKGWIGIATGAAIFALVMGLQAAAKSSINSMFPDIDTNVGEAAKPKKLAPGMLTYKEGRYPVLGNDGQTYNAKYVPTLKTGLYGGGAHYGIFSEKEPEIVIDGPTTKNMMLYNQGLFESIMYLRDHKALPTYAYGRYPETTAPQTQLEQADTTSVVNAVVQSIAPLFEANINVMSRLNDELSRGIGVRKYGKNSLDEGIRDINSFNKSNGR